MRSATIRFMMLIMLISGILSGLLFAGERGVIQAIPAPAYPYGLTYDGSYLWVGCSSTNSADQLYKLDPSDGTVVATIPVPDNNGYYTVKALTFDGQYLWVFEDLPSASHPDKLYKVDPSDGTVLKTINSPVNNYVGGMTYENDHIWMSHYYGSTPEGVLLKIDTTGVPVDTIVTEGEQPMGVAFDGQFVWCVEDSGYGNTEDKIYQYDPATAAYTGTSIRNPSERPRDMTWDGQYLWLVNYGSTEIYKIDLEGGTPNIDLPVTSLDFGLVSVGDSASLTLNILNNGTDVLQLDSLVFSENAFSGDMNSFPVLLDPGTGASLEVTFKPADVGLVNGNLFIYSNDPDEPEVMVTLQGQGQYSQPTIWVAENAHDFGNVWIPMEGKAKWNLKVANSGNQDLEIVSLDMLHGSSEFSSGGYDSFPITIAPNDTFDLQVFFQPGDTTTYLDTLAIGSTDTNNPFVFVELTGTGILDDYTNGYVFWRYNVPDNPVAGSYQEYEVDGLQTINDINGDGAGEVIIATENYWIMCLDGAGSGNTDTLWTFTSYISNYSAGSIGANLDYGVQDAIDIASDLNGDGFNDVVIATGGGNEHVYAIDGTNGNMLWQYGTDDPNSYGMGDFEAVDARRDFNGDGVPDVLAIADGNQEGTGYKSVYLFDGTNGAIIWDYEYPGPNLSFGKSVISVESVSGDSIPDVMIAVGNNGDTGLKTYCLNGETGFVIWDRDAVGYEPKELQELPVSGESPDVIVGEYFGTIQRLDGETGIPLWTASMGNLAGILQMDIISDINDDGTDDVLVASFSGAVSCLSGADGSTAWYYPMDYQYGVAAVPDLNSDGYEDVIVGGGSNNPDTGFIYCLSGKGDNVLFSQTLSGDRVNVVNVLPSIDGNDSYEFLAATKAGQVICYSGGLNPTAISGSGETVPQAYALGQNYPNPFNPATIIDFTLPRQSAVTLKVFNVIGQEVATLMNHRVTPAGNHQVQFNAAHLPSGLYIYRLESEFGVLTRKMILMK